MTILMRLVQVHCNESHNLELTCHLLLLRTKNTDRHISSALRQYSIYTERFLECGPSFMGTTQQVSIYSLDPEEGSPNKASLSDESGNAASYIQLPFKNYFIITIV